MRKSADRGAVLHFCMHDAPPIPGGSRGKQTVQKPEGEKGKQMQFVVAPTKRGNKCSLWLSRQKGKTNAVCGCPDKKGKQMQFVLVPTKRENKCSLWLSRQKGKTNAVCGCPDKKGKQMQLVLVPTKRENKCSLWLSRHTDAIEENTVYEM